MKSLSPGGVLRIREGGWVSSRTVEFEADASGTIRRRYWEGMSEKPFVPDGKAWLSQALPRIIRQTAFGAAGRVARILKAKGPAGVLAEIALIEGSWAKRVYFTELLKSPGLDAATVRQALEQAGRQIDSDFELASLLISSDRLLVDDATRRAYFDAAAEHPVGLRDAPRRTRPRSSADRCRPRCSPACSTRARRSSRTSRRPSSSCRSRGSSRSTPARARRSSRPSATIDSDFECRRVVSAVVRADPSPETLATMLDPSIAIDSDFEQASFLIDVAKSQPIDGPLRAPFFKGVDTIESSFERGRVLQAVVKRGNLLAGDRRGRAAIGAGHGQRPRDVAGAAGRRRRRSRSPARRATCTSPTAERLGDFEQGRALSALVKSEKRK